MLNYWAARVHVEAEALGSVLPTQVLAQISPPKAVSKQKWDGSCVLHLDSTKTTINTKLGKNKGTGKLPLRKIQTKSKF